MIRSKGIVIFHVLFLWLIVWGAPGNVCAEEKKAAAGEPAGLQQRIDFGNAQILGQSIKSGAVYLMHRKKSDIKNMLEVRQHYRDEIKEDFDLDKTALVEKTVEPEKSTKK